MALFLLLFQNKYNKIILMFGKILKLGLGQFFSSRIAKAGVFVVLAIVILGGASYYSYNYGYLKGIENPKIVIVRGVTDLEKGKEEGIDFSVFWEAWQMIKDKYVKADELDSQNLVYGAVRGLIGSLEDQNSVFMEPSDAKKFNEDIAGEFSGIGAEIGIRNDQLVIIAPLKETPAEKAGLKPMDKILKIGDKSTDGLIVDEAVKLIRGLKGTTVILTVLRQNWDKPKEIPIIRDTIQIPTLDWEIKDDNIAYFRLYNFYEQAPLLFYQAVVKTSLSAPKGIILDLRNNPGGYLEASVNLAGWFLEKGEIVVSEKFRSGEKQDFKSYGSGFLKDLPIVVLINEGSASASEILAGALRDNRGVKLIGKKSFGKGTVQELQTLKDGSMVKITVAYWLLPKGHQIEKNGLVPDYEVDLTEEDIKAEKDPQLEKAIEVLKQDLAL
ncbi:MAG: S41 family peptidase [Patescibacteria group bacterium]